MENTTEGVFGMRSHEFIFEDENDENPYARVNDGQPHYKFNAVPKEKPSKLQDLCRLNNVAVRDIVYNPDKEMCQIMQIGEKGFKVFNYEIPEDKVEWYELKMLTKQDKYGKLVPLIEKTNDK
jgi:hypothetical protein